MSLLIFQGKNMAQKFKIAYIEYLRKTTINGAQMEILEKIQLGLVIDNNSTNIMNTPEQTKADAQEKASFQEISNDDVKENISVSSDPNSFQEQYEEVPHKNYGRTIPIGLTPDGKEKYLLGPHYYVFIIAWLASTGTIIYMLVSLYPFSQKFPFGCSMVTSFFFAYTYLKMGISRPGIASSPTIPDQSSVIDPGKYCIPCKIIRQRGTRHCYYCDVCIFEYDHHCPWVGKCIGRDNISQFYIFLCTIGLSFAAFIWTAFTAAPSGSKSAL